MKFTQKLGDYIHAKSERYAEYRQLPPVNEVIKLGELAKAYHRMLRFHEEYQSGAVQYEPRAGGRGL
jgi:hypothetical protein